jgi:hypothetical protein
MLPSGYLRRSSGRIVLVSPWIIWPTFSSSDIRAISRVTKASVFGSTRPRLFAAGHNAGCATPRSAVCADAGTAASARAAPDSKMRFQVEFIASLLCQSRLSPR